MIEKKIWKWIKKFFIIYLISIVLIGAIWGFCSAIFQDTIGIAPLSDNVEKIGFDWAGWIGAIANTIWGSIAKTGASVFVGILEALVLFAIKFVEPVFNACQDAIFILLGGNLMTNALGITYQTYMIILLIIFIVLSVAFSFIKIFGKDGQNVIKNVLKAGALLIIIPMLFSLTFFIFDSLAQWLNSSSLNSQSIFDTVTEYNFGVIQQIDPNQPIDYDQISKNIGLVIIGVVTIYSVFFFFIKFVIGLAVRLYEILILSILGLSYAVSSSIFDDGRRLSIYNSIMIEKIVNSFLCVFGYLLIIHILPGINSNIYHSKFDSGLINFSDSNDVKQLLITAVTIGSFAILVSLSKEWSYLISGGEKASISKQFEKMNISTKPVVVSTGTNIAEQSGMIMSKVFENDSKKTKNLEENKILSDSQQFTDSKKNINYENMSKLEIEKEQYKYYFESGNESLWIEKINQENGENNV